MVKAKQPDTKQQALDNLENAIITCDKVGITIGVAPMYGEVHRNTVAILLVTDVKDGHFVAIDNITKKE
jgi:hypothetical protein